VGVLLHSGTGNLPTVRYDLLMKLGWKFFAAGDTGEHTYYSGFDEAFLVICHTLEKN